MNPIIAQTLTVTGAAGIVASIVQGTKWIIDRYVKDADTNEKVTRIYVFLVATGVVALPILHDHGFHLQGDLLSLLSVAGIVAGTSITLYHLLTQKPLRNTPMIYGVSDVIHATDTLGLPIPASPVEPTQTA